MEDLPDYVEEAKYQPLSEWLKLFKVLLVVSPHMADLLCYVALYVHRFVAMEPLTIVQFLDARNEACFKKEIASLCNILVDGDLGDLPDLDLIRKRPMDALDIILESADFFAYLVAYSCCEEVLHEPGWSKYIHGGSKVRVVLLSSDTSTKQFSRFECRSLPEVSEEKILEEFDITVDEKEAVVEHCGGSLFELKMANYFVQSQGFRLAEFRQMMSADAMQERWSGYRQQHLENFDPLFQKVLGGFLVFETRQ